MKWKWACLCSFVVLLSAENIFAQQTIPISGTLDLVEQKISIELDIKDQGALRINVDQAADQSYQLILSVTNWTTYFLNLSAFLTGSFKTEIDENGKLYITGKLISKYVLLDGQPFEELVVDFLLRDQSLIIRSFRMGFFSGFGEINLKDKLNLDFKIRFSNLELEDVIRFLEKNGDIDGQGIVDGDVQLKGPTDHLQVRGRINSFNGFVNDHGYNEAQIYFDGIYPTIYIDNSHIAQTDGLSFVLQGSLDLSDMQHLRDQIRRLSKSALVSESDQSLEWTLKSIKSGEDGSKTEFKYMLQKDDEAGGMLGVERKIEF